MSRRTVIDLGADSAKEAEWHARFRFGSCDVVWDYEQGEFRHHRHCQRCQMERERQARMQHEFMWTRPRL